MNQRAAVLSLISPAYLWLTLTILLPLSAMLYYSFLSDVPIGNREVSWTLENYGTFFEKAFYSELMLRSFKLCAEVTVFCLLLGFPCALALVKSIG